MTKSNARSAFEAKLLTLEGRSVEEALSVFEALSSRPKAPECPIVILHSNKDNKVVSLGCFQIADEDFLTDYLHKKGFKYFFRLHGGDIMLHDENQVGIALITPRNEEHKTYTSLIDSLMKRNGISNFYITNDSILCFNKVLGEVIHVEKDDLMSWFVFIYLKRNYEEMAGLKSSKEQLIKERINMLKQNYVGLDQVLGKQISAYEFLKSVETVLTDDLNFKIKGLRLGFGDKKLFWKSRTMLRRNIISDTIHLKHSAVLSEKDAILLSKRLINGFLRIRVRIKDNVIEKISISGSFMFEPPEKLGDFGRMLEGKELDETLLTEKITEFFINEKIKTSFTALEMVSLLLQSNRQV